MRIAIVLPIAFSVVVLGVGAAVFEKITRQPWDDVDKLPLPMAATLAPIPDERPTTTTPAPPGPPQSVYDVVLDTLQSTGLDHDKAATAADRLSDAIDNRISVIVTSAMSAEQPQPHAVKRHAVKRHAVMRQP